MIKSISFFIHRFANNISLNIPRFGLLITIYLGAFSAASSAQASSPKFAIGLIKAKSNYEQQLEVRASYSINQYIFVQGSYVTINEKDNPIRSAVGASEGDAFGFGLGVQNTLLERYTLYATYELFNWSQSEPFRLVDDSTKTIESSASSLRFAAGIKIQLAQYPVRLIGELNSLKINPPSNSATEAGGVALGLEFIF